MPMEHLEGRLSVLAALMARRRKFQVILVSHQAHAQKIQPVLDLAEELGIPVKRADGRELNDMAHGVTHGGVIAVCSAKPRTSADDLSAILAASPAPPLLLLLEGIDDARNLGFTLRSAEAMGAQAVLVKKHLWDFDEVEVARPSSGAYERLPLVQIETTRPLELLQRSGVRLLAADPNAGTSIQEADLTGGVILAIGGEKRGLSGAVRDICDQRVRIPTAGGASSLALSHAAAIILAEAMRQRTVFKKNPSSGRLSDGANS
jgi:23S rRNA (guanosine2251-2'-O)-methyltransferase